MHACLVSETTRGIGPCRRIESVKPKPRECRLSAVASAVSPVTAGHSPRHDLQVRQPRRRPVRYSGRYHVHYRIDEVEFRADEQRDRYLEAGLTTRRASRGCAAGVAAATWSLTLHPRVPIQVCM